MTKKACIGLNPASQTHYIDHLAVVCILMDMPLLFIEEADWENGKKYYPGLKCECIPDYELTPEYLVSRYDVLFMSDHWDKQTFRERFQLLGEKYSKQMRSVYCPHGFSDKGYYLKDTAFNDIALLYGQNMIDQIKHYNVFHHLEQYVITGNIRYTYYKQHQKFFDQIVEKEVFSKLDPEKKTILYAPTCLDLEESTTFYDHFHTLFEQLPAHYNLLVKVHPLLELNDAGLYYHIVGKYADHPNITFLEQYPLVYPLLARSDIYLGDMSAIGYDFLTFNKPMFFLNKGEQSSESDRRRYLFRCGTEIHSEGFLNIFDTIDAHLENDAEQFGKIREQVYAYTFGPERPFGEIKSDIIAEF